LAAAGEAFAAERLELLDNQRLADAIEKRSQSLAKWKKIYWDEFIPFAHGVRRLATYYNDAVQPDDPYEFVGLLRDQPLLAAQRNSVISELARQLGSNRGLRTAVEQLLAKHANSPRWSTFRDALLNSGVAAEEFVQRFDDLQQRFLDVTYDDQRLHDRPGPLLSNLVELSQHSIPLGNHGVSPRDSVSALEEKLLAAVGLERRAEAMDVVETGRVSWRLRDDDNLLVARLDSQCLRALELAAERLRALGRLTGDGHVNHSHLALLVCGLRDPSTGVITIEHSTTSEEPTFSVTPPGQTPRQLIGQPASPGLATGVVRCIYGRDDLGKFRQGEILVCDAIQPTMTHLVPLAGGIVERRGGMLIHGAIIARELRIPCVNGVRDAAQILKNGDLVTVDGHLGIVTVGTADFDLEMQV
jgi:pyruvate,water dikinase